MLTIENITKVYKKDVGSLWRVGRVDTTNTSYLFTLINPVGQRIQVNLERNPIGVQYELWCWDSYQNNTPLPTAVPRRRMLDMDKLKTQLATNTKSIQLPKFTLNLHPNPTSETLQITTDSPVDEIQIYNSIGQQVWQGQGFRDNQVRVNVRDFSDGMYIVRVRQGEVWVSEQVLVL